MASSTKTRKKPAKSKAKRPSKTAVLRELKAAGTAQNQKVYARHGVKGPMFGVSYAALGKLKKQIGTDHRVAEGLWDSGVHDARVLACMIADPAEATRANLNDTVRQIDNYVLSDAFSSFVARTPLALDRAMKWKDAKAEFTAAVGWNVIASLALDDSNDLDTAFFEDRLREIEAGIGDAKNRTRHSMNQALIAIGSRSKGLRRKAEAAAKRIGTVVVDHGETSCKTPAATPYLAKVWARKERNS